MVEKGTLKAQRFLTAIKMQHPEHLENVSRELWNRIWSRVSIIDLLFGSTCNSSL
jgi:glutathione S-transferase kappa 1